MQLNLPEFAEGIHFEKLDGCDEGSNRKYRFRLLADIRIRIPLLAGQENRISFRDYKRIEWARIEYDLLVIRKGYAWNGASPCIWIPLIGWIGTPTPHSCILATLVHDVCWQFCMTHGWPISAAQANDLFLQIMKQNDFPLANAYLGAVRDFGSRFLGKYPSMGEHSYDLNP